MFPNGVQVIFWVVLSLVLLAPLVAIWRNCSALSLMCAQMATSGRPRADRLAPLVETALKTLAGGMMFIWVAALMPVEGSARWLMLASVFIAMIALAVLWRKLVFWHSQLEFELQEVITSAEGKMTATSAPWLQPHSDWHLHMIDCVLPDLADVQGRTIAELDLRARFGCSVVGIERQGFMIPLPPPDSVLYPRDRVLLMGTTDQVKAGKKFLSGVSGTSDSLYEEILMESVKLPPGSRVADRTLAELSPARAHGVQIAGVNRHGLRILNPSAEERLQVGDEVLVLGGPTQIREFKAWLEGESGKL
jgi:CPA2 family monovalent cation:H+ antiporter-2